MRFVLASASPARLRTLRAAGVDPEVIVSDVDEAAIIAASPDMSPSQLVVLLAGRKALDVAFRLEGQAPALVLGCDSMLEFDGVALGKPATREIAVERWKQMRGQSGTLRTGHVLIDSGQPRMQQGQVEINTVQVATTVNFADITDEEVELYCSTGEPTTVAGAFTIDGLGSWFVSDVMGDHHNVVGVSLPHVRILLRQMGYRLSDIGYPTS